MDARDQSEISSSTKDSRPGKFNLPFKVFAHDSSKKKLAQPEDPPETSNKRKKQLKNYPFVSVLEEDSKNEFSFHIMLTVNHTNIISMRTILGHSTNENLSSVIVEEYSGVLRPELKSVILDPYGNIPSAQFQKIVRDLIEAVDFLRQNGLYHGNLKWDSVLHNVYVVKLAYFKQKEDSVTLQQAQWNDWLGLLIMFEYIMEIALNTCEDPNKHRQVFVGELEVLIRILKESDMSCLGTIKDSLLDNAFFWDSEKRSELFICNLPRLLKVKDEAFLTSINDSNICDLPWYVSDETTILETLVSDEETLVSDEVLSANKEFGELVILMNKHQDPLSPFDPEKIIDFLEFVSGGYTHTHELQLNVDSIIRAKFPRACLELKRVIDILQKQAK